MLCPAGPEHFGCDSGPGQSPHSGALRWAGHLPEMHRLSLRTGGETPVLACQTPVQEGMTVRLPSAAPLSVTLEGAEADVPCPPDGGLKGYGVACDIGTTTVVCHLVDLSCGKRVATVGGGQCPAPLWRRCHLPHPGLYGGIPSRADRRYHRAAVPDDHSAAGIRRAGSKSDYPDGGGRQYHHVPSAHRYGSGQPGGRALHPAVPVRGSVGRPGAGTAL